jgi:hypothetical protein
MGRSSERLEGSHKGWFWESFEYPIVTLVVMDGLEIFRFYRMRNLKLKGQRATKVVAATGRGKPLGVTTPRMDSA